MAEERVKAEAREKEAVAREKATVVLLPQWLHSGMTTVANRGTITPMANPAGRVLDEDPTNAGKTERLVLIISKIRGIN